MSNRPDTYGRDQHSAAAARTCNGECLDRANEAFQDACKMARDLGCGLKDIDKRFKYLLETTAKNQHEQAEVILEHALAIYEAAFGQEDPSVAHMLSTLAKLQASHGKQEYGNYLESWGSDILSSTREEPTHEFFNLFGWNQTPSAEAPVEDCGSST